MEPRRSLLIGGGAATVVGVAVALTFAVSNASALPDVAGESIAVAAIVVPAPAESPTPQATPRPTATPIATPETVPAPQPRDVAPEPEVQPEAPAEEAPVTPVVPAPAPSPTQQEIEATVREFAENRDWDGLRVWVSQQGWTPEELQAIIDDLRQKYPEFARASASASADSTSDSGLPGSRVGSKRDQSRNAPESG